MSKTVSMRLTDRQLAGVEKIKRRYSQPSISSTLQLLLEEKLREEQYAYIIFRDTPAGRRAFIEGTGLAVWEVMMIASYYRDDVAKSAEHLVIREDLVRLAMDYTSDHQEEIDAIIAANDATEFRALRRILPGVEEFTVPAEREIESTEAG